MSHLNFSHEAAVVTHTIREKEIATLPASWFKNTPSVKMLCPQKIASLYIFISQVFMSPVKLCQWVITDCSFLSDLLHTHIPYFCRINLSMCSSKWLFSSKFSYQNFIFIFYVLHPSYMS